MKKFIMLALVFALTGCSLLTETVSDAAQNVGQGITFYCENTDVYVREQFNILVNAGAAPNSVTVQCANGYELHPATSTPNE